MLKLVKDFSDYQFIYFWVNICDKKANKISDSLPTLQHAQEWFIDYHYAQYKGVERRQFKQDRRLDSNKVKRPSYCVRSTSCLGRRVTDKAIKVDMDLSKKKIAELQTQAASESSNLSENISSAN